MFVKFLVKTKNIFVVDSMVCNQQTVHKIKGHTGKKVYRIDHAARIFNLNDI